LSTSHIPERRRHPRICLPFPAAVVGQTDGGEAFRAETVLDDLSVGGVYLRLLEGVPLGACVSITARFSVVTDRGLVARLEGKVVRVDPKPGGVFGVAVAVEDRQIL
jgi:hypothetical protein